MSKQIYSVSKLYILSDCFISYSWIIERIHIFVCSSLCLISEFHMNFATTIITKISMQVIAFEIFQLQEQQSVFNLDFGP